jgi:hypothetical protein
MNEQRLITRVVARGVGLPQALQYDVHRHQDVASLARVLGDSRGGRHAKVLQNRRDVPS